MRTCHTEMCVASLTNMKYRQRERLQIVMQNLQGKPQTFLKMQQNDGLWSSTKFNMVCKQKLGSYLFHFCILDYMNRY